MEPLQPGQRIGAYRIIQQLGAGGMGQVYEAEHVALGASRALKVFSTESEHSEFLRKRFVAEGRILADLKHPRIVRVYDLVVDEDSGMAYFEMDLVLSPNGQPRTLADEQRDGVDEGKVAGWFRDICEGLAYIHSQGIVHRDMSLDNILIGPDGHAVITDFGIAKIIDDSYRRKIDVTVTMVAKDGAEFRMGKGLYMAPELKKQGGRATFASDAYAVGVILFRLLSGSWYDVGTHLEDWLADFEYEWHPIISQLCNEDPENRLGEGGIGALPPFLKRKKQLVPFWQRAWIIGCGVAFALAVVGLVSMFFIKKSAAVKPVPEKKQRPAAEILKGADEGKTDDMVLAAEMYRDGKGVATNYAKSVELYRKAIADGSFDAVGGIGTLYEHGWGVTNNPHTAYLMYLVSAANGVSNSLQDVIRCYEDGIGVGKNSNEARKWKRRKVLIPLENKAKDDVLHELDAVNEDKESVKEYTARLEGSSVAKVDGIFYQYGKISNETVTILGSCDESNANVRSKFGVDIKRRSQAQRRSIHGDMNIPAMIDGMRVAQIDMGAFHGYSNLSSISVSSNVQTICASAFMECVDLEKVSLEEGVLHIGDIAFYRCNKLHGVVLPHSVTNVGVLAFYPAPPTVPEDHPNFTFKDGALYSKDMSTLYAYYGSNDTFSVATNTKYIAEYAFLNARSLKYIILPESLETIADYAFNACSSLTSLTIPEGVTNIGSRVFCECCKLSGVYYQGRIPHVANDVYEGRCYHSCLISFVKKNYGWENSSGMLPRQWPDQTRRDIDLLNHGSSDSGSCHTVRYWENGKIYSRDEMIPMQIELLRAEASRGNVAAMKSLAWKYEHGIDGIKKDIGEAVKFLEGAANGSNDGKSMCTIGDFYRKGINGKRNYPEAVRWYRNALECGGKWGMRACQELANLYRNGLGVEKDMESAFMLTLIAAANKMNGAQCVLSDCYEKGIGVETNPIEAARWDKEAEKTCWSGHELGLWYKYGGGVVDKDPKKAFRWFMYGVKQGNGVSAVEIAECYKNGYGVEKDLSKVYEYSMIGAQKGWSCGMRSVAECYENGWSVETNLVKAAEWYIKAAEADKDYWDGGVALIKAGDCYAEGLGVKKDYAKAREWYEKAVSRRNSNQAKRKIEELDERIKREKEERIRTEISTLYKKGFSNPGGKK